MMDEHLESVSTSGGQQVPSDTYLDSESQSVDRSEPSSSGINGSVPKKRKSGGETMSSSSRSRSWRHKQMELDPEGFKEKERIRTMERRQNKQRTRTANQSKRSTNTSTAETQTDLTVSANEILWKLLPLSDSSGRYKLADQMDGVGNAQLTFEEDVIEKRNNTQTATRPDEQRINGTNVNLDNHRLQATDYNKLPTTTDVQDDANLVNTFSKLTVPDRVAYHSPKYDAHLSKTSDLAAMSPSFSIPSVTSEELNNMIQQPELWDDICSSPRNTLGASLRVIAECEGGDIQTNKTSGSDTAAIAELPSPVETVGMPLEDFLTSKVSASTETLLSPQLRIGIGRFSGGKFSKTTSNSTIPGGMVCVGPFDTELSTAAELKDAAFDKFQRENRNFRKMYSKSGKFVLVYPDGTLVDKLPDGSGNFTIAAYRKFVDPRMKYDRLRMYLCRKDEHSINTSLVEIVTDSSTSSDEELPRLQQSRTKDNDGDKTLPFSIEIRFLWGVHILSKIFQSDKTVKDMLEYLHQTSMRDTAKTILLLHGDTILSPDDPVFTLTTHDSIPEITVQELDSDDASPISAKYDIGSNDNHKDTIQNILRETIAKLGDTNEPTKVIQEYAAAYNRGRDLDVTSESSGLDGETSPIYISRYRAFEDSMEELEQTKNIRFPIEANFYGEMAQDYGGPRREFFGLVMKEIKDILVDERDNGEVTITKSISSLSRHKYYYAGLLMGLSIIQGGPMPTFLDSLMEAEDEYSAQMKEGLKRVGIKQLMDRKPSIKFLFRPSAVGTLTVNKLISLLAVNFDERGSNRRMEQEKTYRAFLKYTREVFAGRRQPVTLARILAFTTGSEQEPTLGFTMKPTMEFTPATLFATSSTCVNRLTLPLIEDKSEEVFFGRLDYAFSNDFFGLN